MSNSNQEIDALRKEVKHRMIDLGLDREGSYDRILPHLNRVAGFVISKSQLSMSLTGYRDGDKHVKILESLRGLLAAWPPEDEPVSPCEHIHDRETEDN